MLNIDCTVLLAYFHIALFAHDCMILKERSDMTRTRLSFNPLNDSCALISAKTFFSFSGEVSVGNASITLPLT
jgi:hypothetical protein